MAKKSASPKLPDFSARASAPAFSAGTPGAISGPISSTVRPSPSTTAPEVSPPAVISRVTPPATSRRAASANSASTAAAAASRPWRACAAFTAAEVAHWLIGQGAARDAAPGAAPLAYSSADPAEVAAAQARHGRETAAAAVEALFAGVARLLVEGGVTRLITAGGETSGAVVEGLGLSVLEIGPEIAPGVPALKAGALALALKSGNFGDVDFFTKAARVLAGGQGAQASDG